MLAKASIRITFRMDKPDNRVEYDIWYTSTDDRALDFLDDFKDYDYHLGEKVLMTPHFVTFNCTECDTEFKSTECYGDGKYCAIYHKGTQQMGQEIIQEDLRQKCIYNSSIAENGNAKNFWDYT